MPANVTVIAGAAQVDLYLGNYSYANVVASMENLKFKAATDINRIVWKNASGTAYKLMHDASTSSNHSGGRVLFTDNNGAANSSSALTFDGTTLACSNAISGAVVTASSQLNIHSTLNVLSSGGVGYTTVGMRNASGPTPVLDLYNIGTVNLPLLTESRILELDASKNVISVAKGTSYNKNFGTSSGTVCEGNDSRLSDARTPTSHYHSAIYDQEGEEIAFAANSGGSVGNYHGLFAQPSAVFPAPGDAALTGYADVCSVTTPITVTNKEVVRVAPTGLTDSTFSLTGQVDWQVVEVQNESGSNTAYVHTGSLYNVVTIAPLTAKRMRYNGVLDVWAAVE